MHLGIIKITYNRTAKHFMDDSFMNLGEEVILTLLWQSGASESATVCFVISLSICLLLTVQMQSFALCVCVWERERERERERDRERESEREREREREREGANTYEHHHCVSQPSPAWTDGKTKDIINCLHFYFES